MNRQDRGMVRTASELERKYNLAGMKKAFEQSENTLTRINKILQDYVNTVVGTLENFEGLGDGNITTYFYSGVPSLDTEPTKSWTDIFENHINDLYYDKNSGKAYAFSMNSDESYEWVEVIDENKIKVLAMANATTDAKDGFRRIFVEEPTTPYDNGDLWLKDGVIYICQISKPSTETFENHDFIVSSQYAGDTLAIKIGTELEVLKGTVLKVIEDADFLKIELTDKDTDLTSQIDFIKNSLSTLIRDEKGESMVVQTENGWEFSMKSIIETLQSNSEKVSELESESNQTKTDVDKIDELVKVLEEKTTYIRMGQLDGEACIILGSEDSDFSLVITQTNIRFMEGNESPAYMSNKTMVITRAYIKEQLQIATLGWVKRANRHISLMEVRDNGDANRRNLG